MADTALRLLVCVGSLVAPVAIAQEAGFNADVVPFLRAHCVACHLTGEEQGGMALHPQAAHGALVGVPSLQSALNRVEPGDPERSYLYLKLMNRHIEAGGQGEPMPLGNWPLKDHEIELVRRWISRGAPAD